MARTGHPGIYEENPIFQIRSNECFDRSLYDVCLNEQWFKSRIDAKILSEDFRHEFNEVRLHSDLGWLTPAEIKRQLSTITLKAAVSEA
jgi:putative transposase